MKTRKKGIRKETWFSFCSKHREYDKNCPLCKEGRWSNNIKYKISSFIFDNFPKLWIYFVNLSWLKLLNKILLAIHKQRTKIH